MTVEWPEDLIARCTRITVDMSELFILKGRRMDMLANAKAKVNGNANANANVNANANANGEKEEAKNDSDNNNNTIRGETPKQLLVSRPCAPKSPYQFFPPSFFPNPLLLFHPAIYSSIQSQSAPPSSPSLLFPSFPPNPRIST